ncbi:hypothetical protein V1517DRAFT_262520 [Lipomyces orientalis]|uniref:Uncharacterized protein n=1 Tax=Lipomyces orientalis TaxID=1233043 RepID=A0ACC3TKT9_9ASCO
MPYIINIIQSGLLKALGNIFGQCIIAFRRGNKSPWTTIQWTSVIAFTSWAAINVPLLLLWNHFLNRKFPSVLSYIDDNKKDRDSKKKEEYSYSNVIIKVILTESIFSVFINTVFIVYMSFSQGQTERALISYRIQKDLPNILANSMKLWPLITFISCAYMAPAKQVLFRSAIGVLWTVYLSIVPLG